MAPSKLDSLYRRLLITRFFEKGWGKPENLQRLFEFRKIISCREACFRLIPRDYPIKITRNERQVDCSLLEGNFMTPLEMYLPGLVPIAAQQAYFQVLLPKNWKEESYKPMCIHLAGTGDHYFWRRRNLIGKPLLKEAHIGAIILENPFYGKRKPDGQVLAFFICDNYITCIYSRSNLHNVSDIFVMGGCLILECLVLLHWCEMNGYGPLGISGISMGGHMASLAATNWPRPLALIPCLSWSTASAVFTTGVMSQSINWDMLETQYFSDGNYSERLAKMVTVVDDSFTAGKNFVSNFSQSIEELRKDINTTKNETYSYSEKIEIKENTNFIKRKENESQIKSSLTQLMEYILPESKHGHFDAKRTKWWEREALQFMRGMMDECTHLKNFSVPYDTSLIIVVCAKEDAYVPREGCSSLEEIWPGVEVKYLDAGHVSAYVLYQKLFRSCIVQAFERARIKNQEYNLKRPFNDELTPTVTYKELLQQYQNRCCSFKNSQDMN